MKKIIIIFPFLLFLCSCESEGPLTQEKVDPIITPTATLVSSGTFTATSGITVTGKAEIYLDSGKHQVRLENFSISSGPDLKVYLSKNDTPSEFVNLGNLTSATVYQIPAEVNLSDYKYVLIHCQQYNHLFAVAELAAN